MKLIIAILLLVMPASAQTATTDRPQVEREVMSVLDAFVDAFNHQDARAEERTYHFPHYRLAIGQMAVFDTPGAATETWMNNTYRTLRETEWDHTAWSGGRHGHPLLVDRALFDRLRHADPIEGAKPVVHAHATPAGNVEVDDEGAFGDIDTPDEYERALSVFGGVAREDQRSKKDVKLFLV